MEKVLLVDGSNLARRNYHGQNLSTSSGLKTGVIYGTINSLLSIQGQLKAETVVVVWDAAGCSQWRKDIYPLYKANRNPPEADYIDGLGYLKELLHAMGVIQIEKGDAEADDIIGYLAKVHFSDKRAYILSGDQDFYQLIDDRIHVVSPTQGVIEPEPSSGTIPVKDGNKVIWLRPDQIVDYKCLKGDTADNIPGAPGFGIGAAITFFENNDKASGNVSLKGLQSRAIQGLLAVKPFLDTYRRIITINIEAGTVELPPRPEIQSRKVEAMFSLFEFNQFKARGEYVYIIGGLA